MVKVPVLLDFDHEWPIGMLEVDEAKLPIGADFHFAIGYRAGRDPRTVELVSVSPVLDEKFAYSDGRGAVPVPATVAVPEVKPSREEVWLRAWVHVGGAFNCKTADAATRWADRALETFDARFPPK